MTGVDNMLALVGGNYSLLCGKVLIVLLLCVVYFSGGLAFLIVWFVFLWVWSIPIILIEYGVGRFTKKSTIESFYKLIGPSYRFMGGFQAFVGFALG